MSIRMIATDMDGTLLDGQGQVDLLRFERVLVQLEERQIKFVVATGNEIGRMRNLFGPELTRRITFVVANGARIFEGEDLIVEQRWDSRLVQDVLAYFSGKELDYHLVANLHNGPHAIEGKRLKLAKQLKNKKISIEGQINVQVWLGHHYLTYAKRTKYVDKANELFEQSVEHYKEWLQLTEQLADEQNRIEQQTAAQSWLVYCYIEQAKRINNARGANDLFRLFIKHNDKRLKLAEPL